MPFYFLVVTKHHLVSLSLCILHLLCFFFLEQTDISVKRLLSRHCRSALIELFFLPRHNFKTTNNCQLSSDHGHFTLQLFLYFFCNAFIASNTLIVNPQNLTKSAYIRLPRTTFKAITTATMPLVNHRMRSPRLGYCSSFGCCDMRSPVALGPALSYWTELIPANPASAPHCTLFTQPTYVYKASLIAPAHSGLHGKHIASRLFCKISGS